MHVHMHKFFLKDFGSRKYYIESVLVQVAWFGLCVLNLKKKFYNIIAGNLPSAASHLLQVKLNQLLVIDSSLPFHVIQVEEEEMNE